MITLKTLPQATAQEVYNQVRDHLLAQNCVSAVGDSWITRQCLYRGPNGTKCAAGCLIGDDEYKPEMEKTSWDRLVKQEIVPGNHEELIVKLQRVHDGSAVEDWSIELTLVAREFDLVP
jgi:hypothetical protein